MKTESPEYNRPTMALFLGFKEVFDRTRRNTKVLKDLKISKKINQDVEANTTKN